MTPRASGLSVNAEALASLSGKELEEAEQAFAELQAAVQANPLLLYNNPALSQKPIHQKQIHFHRRPTSGLWLPLRSFFGGNRSGKTTAGMVDTILQALPPEFVPQHLLPYKRWFEVPFKCRIMTPDFGDTHEVILEKIREWCPKAALRGNTFDRAYDKQKKVLWFKDGSRFHFNSNVQEREQLGGSDLHRVVYDEEPRRDLRSESLTRLIDHDGEEIFCMTPLEGMSWLFDEVYEPWEKALEEHDEEWAERELEMRITVVDMDDNPHLSESGKRRALASYSGAEREARKSGRFVSFAGLIYPQFRKDHHVIPQIDELPKGSEVFVGIDPGLRNMAAVFCYLTFDDTMVAFDELLLQEQTIREMCDALRGKCEEWRIEPNWYVIDPAARNKNPQTGRSDQQEFVDNGIYTLPGQNAVGAGINRVRERLDHDRLLICANCEGLREEFRRYRYVRQKTRGENDPKQAPVKANDHRLDALRYVVAQRPMRPKEEMPEETLTTRDRLLRHHLRRNLRKRKRPDNEFGPGIFK